MRIRWNETTRTSVNRNINGLYSVTGSGEVMTYMTSIRIPNEKLTKQQELDEAKAAFFANGGKVEMLDGFKCVKPIGKPIGKPKGRVKTSNEVKRRRNVGAKVYSNGLTIREMSEQSGVPFSTVRARLERGLSFEQAMDPNLPNEGGVNAKVYDNGLTARQMAELHGIPVGTVRHRLKSGWPLEDIGKPVDTRFSSSVFMEGK